MVLWLMLVSSILHAGPVKLEFVVAAARVSLTASIVSMTVSGLLVEHGDIHGLHRLEFAFTEVGAVNMEVELVCAQCDGIAKCYGFG